MAYNYQLIIIYNGKYFHGWQITPGYETVQEIVEMAINKAHRKKHRSKNKIIYSHNTTNVITDQITLDNTPNIGGCMNNQNIHSNNISNMITNPQANNDINDNSKSKITGDSATNIGYHSYDQNINGNHNINSNNMNNITTDPKDHNYINHNSKSKITGDNATNIGYHSYDQNVNSYDQNVNSNETLNYIKITGASRTDSGVHSYGQTANFFHEKLWETNTLKNAINFYLNKEKVIIDSVNIVDNNFHSRYSSKGKIYHYQIFFDPIINPFDVGYWWVINKTIDINKLEEACNFIKISKNLNGFSHWNQQLKVDYTLQNLQFEIDNNKIKLIFQGKGFFYNEIRYLVGHIIYYATGLINKETFLLPLEKPHNKNYKKILAPAHGLFLMKVLY